VDVQDTADEEEGNARPGQDEAIAKVSRFQISRGIQDVFPVEREDEARGERRETCKALAETCEVEESSCGQGEQLTHEDQEGDGGEDHGQDHQGLDGLQPVVFICCSTQPIICCIIMKAVVPQVSDFSICPYPPGLLHSGNEEHGQSDQVQHSHKHKQQNHSFSKAVL